MGQVVDGLEEMGQVVDGHLHVGLDADDVQEEVDDGAHLHHRRTVARTNAIHFALILILNTVSEAGGFFEDFAAKVPDETRLESFEEEVGGFDELDAALSASVSVSVSASAVADEGGVGVVERPEDVE